MNDRFMELVHDTDMDPTWYPEYDIDAESYINEGSDPLVINNMNSELVFKITSDGQIVIGDGYTPSAAADEFIGRLRIRLNTKDHEYITQLESAIEAWKENLNDY